MDKFVSTANAVLLFTATLPTSVRCFMRIQVYPEYYCGELQDDGMEIYGKLTAEGKSRMFLSENGTIMISYDKIRSDGDNVAGDPDQNIEVFTTDDIAIGLVCCMDVNYEPLLSRVKSKLDNSGSAHKIICISAHMSAGSGWFMREPLSPDLRGYIVVLSNGNPDGIKSFIAGVDGFKLDNLSMNIGHLSIINNGC